MQISKYFASMGIEVDKASVKKVDKALDHVENRLKRLGKFANTPITLSLGRFDVDQRRLNMALGNALDMASTHVVFEINRFAVDQQHLNRIMTAATIQATRVAGQNATIRPNVHVNGNGVVGTGRHVSGAIGGGLIGRGIGGLYGPALALGLGGYGLGALNRRNQEVVSAQLQSSAVVQQAGGTAEQGAASFQYLRQEGQRIGFNFLDASGDYNKLISGLTGSGIGLKESQKVFSGFAELARVNKLDKTTQNRLFRALSQVAGKGKLMSEELTGQIAEALPGGTALFAQAYQAQLKARGEGGNKTGAEAIQQLLADMKKGKVTSDILTFAGAAASQRANQGGALAAASQASQAEQARYQNTVNDLAVVASNSGVEEGFARIFRTLNAGLSESGDLVKKLSEGFNEATKWADDLLLFPQSFVRALEGKDSLVGDWLGQDTTKQLQEDWKSIKDSLTTISSIGAPSWLPTLEKVSKDIADQFRIIASLANGDFSGLGDALKDFAVNRYKAYADVVASGPNFALRTIGTALDVSVPQISTEEGISYFAPKSIKDALGLGRGLLENLSFDPLSGAREQNNFNNDAISSEFSSQQAALDAMKNPVTNNSNQIDIVVNVDGSTLAGMDANAQAQAIGEAVANMFVQSFDQVNVQFPVKQ